VGKRPKKKCAGQSQKWTRTQIRWGGTQESKGEPVCQGTIVGATNGSRKEQGDCEELPHERKGSGGGETMSSKKIARGTKPNQAEGRGRGGKKPL